MTSRMGKPSAVDDEDLPELAEDVSVERPQEAHGQPSARRAIGMRTRRVCRVNQSRAVNGQLAEVAAAAGHAFIAHPRYEDQADDEENDVVAPHREQGRDDAVVGERFAANEPGVIDGEYEKTHADDEPHAAARKAERDGRADHDEHDARRGEREFLLDLDVIPIAPVARVLEPHVRVGHLERRVGFGGRSRGFRVRSRRRRQGVGGRRGRDL